MLLIKNNARSKYNQLGIKAGARYLTALRSEKPNKEKVTWSLCKALLRPQPGRCTEARQSCQRKAVPNTMPTYASRPSLLRTTCDKPGRFLDSIFVGLMGGPVSAELSASRRKSKHASANRAAFPLSIRFFPSPVQRPPGGLDMQPPCYTHTVAAVVPNNMTAIAGRQQVPKKSQIPGQFSDPGFGHHR